MAWEVVSTGDLNREMLVALFHSEIGAIRIPNFLSRERCRRAVQGIYAHGIDYYENVYPRIGRIGITQYEHRHSFAQKAEYFRKASIAHANRREMFKDSGDLLLDVIACVRNAWGPTTGLAVEEGTQDQYFAGLIRVINTALLHCDWAQLDAKDWTIGKVSSQVTWNIYLQMGASGGKTIVYRRPWQEPDEASQLPNSYGYDNCLVDECDSVEILPEQGELVFFNSRNFHRVDATAGEVERITVSSFIGLLEPDDQLIFWS